MIKEMADWELASDAQAQAYIQGLPDWMKRFFADIIIAHKHGFEQGIGYERAMLEIHLKHTSELSMVVEKHIAAVKQILENKDEEVP